VRVGIYNAAGRRIALLADATYDEGPHVLHWDTREALGSATGVYFLRTVIGGQTGSSRMLIVR